MSEAGEDKAAGLATAVATLMAETGLSQGRAAALGAMRGEQLALIPSAIALEDAGAGDDQAQRRGPGRPAGSRNRSTDDWVAFIAARYRSPLLFLAETFTRPTEQLAKELDCSKKDAFALQLKAAEDLAPFMHQKQPVAVQISAEGEVTLQLVMPQAKSAESAPPMLTIENEENQ